MPRSSDIWSETFHNIDMKSTIRMLAVLMAVIKTLSTFTVLSGSAITATDAAYIQRWLADIQFNDKIGKTI